MAGIRADALDCLQSTIALIADDAYGPGTHFALGAEWRFPARGLDGAIGVRPSLHERLTQAARDLNFQISGPHGLLDGVGLREMASARPVYVVADAYDLEWVPYAGHRHMPHSFLLDLVGDEYVIIDAYHNDTEWGPARPGCWMLPAATLDRLPGTGALMVTITATDRPPADQEASIAGNAAVARRAGPAINAYANVTAERLARPEGLQHLVLDIWHLARERALHTAWLGTHPAASRVAEQAERWRQLAARSYLTLRRAQRAGTPASTALVTQLTRLLYDDAALATSIGLGTRPSRPRSAGTSPPDAETIGTILRQAIGTVLKLDARAVSGTTALRSLTGFSSFRLVDIIDLAETRLGVAFPDDADPGELTDIAGLSRLFARAERRP
jgi:hypothetical protein